MYMPVETWFLAYDGLGLPKVCLSSMIKQETNEN